MFGIFFDAIAKQCEHIQIANDFANFNDLVKVVENPFKYNNFDGTGTLK